MGRRRLLTVLTATVLSVGALILPASAVELTDGVTETVETVETVASDPVASPSESVGTVTDATSDTTDGDVTSDTTDGVATDGDGDADPVEETVENVVETVEQTLDDPVGSLEDVADDPEGTVEDLVAPLTDPDGEDTGAADDGGVDPAPEPASGDDTPSAGPGTSPSPSWGDLLTAPAMDHGVTAAPSSSRGTAQAAAPADAPAPELAPDVAVPAAAPQAAPIGLSGETVPTLLRIFTALLVAGAAITWRTVQKEFAD